ncbi:hypothetical protein MJN54_34615, partial [Salmonella enterica subsp. enterica serovar Kentucky]|nr:hypothetical protein [Salmonella enterica subsp. enterica serovar Kentucky]
GEAGLRLAYEQAEKGFIKGGVNRILLTTDGDFNLGITDPKDIKASLNQNTEHQLRYQETEFVISYEEFRRPEFTSVPLFKDEMV